jgi:hypothetical protein
VAGVQLAAPMGRIEGVLSILDRSLGTETQRNTATEPQRH